MLVGIPDRVSLCGSFSLPLSSSALYFSVFLFHFAPFPILLQVIKAHPVLPLAGRGVIMGAELLVCELSTA